MILLLALAIGLSGGLGIAHWRHQRYPIPQFRFLWLAVIAFLPQLLIAYLPATHGLLPDRIASILFSGSLMLFLAFAWLNRRLPGMPVLLIGLLLNAVVIAVNGGWMPISPQTASQLTGTDILGVVNLGSRIGQKDVLLLPQDTHLPFLADRFLVPGWLPYRAAFSPGDMFISMGACWLLIKPAVTSTTLSMEGRPM
jgi:hypothetical protein